MSMLPQVAGGVFAATALLGAWIAYDHSISYPRFILITAGLVTAAAIVWVGRRYQERIRMGICIGSIILTALVCVIFVWSSPPALHSNAAAGALIVTLPFTVAALYRLQQRRAWIAVAIVAGILVIAGATLAFTLSRGAWIGLLVGSVAGLALRSTPFSRRIALAVTVGLVVLFAVGFIVAIRVPAFEQSLAGAGADASTLSRVRVWQHMLMLIEDYALTGSGLGMTAMVYSTYVLLLHVPFLYHAHNLFLQIAVEQGMLGAGAFVWLAGIALYRLLTTQSQPLWFLRAVLASLLALVVHGMFDAELYVSGLAPVVFIPIAGALTLTPAPSEAVVVAPRSVSATLGIAVPILVILVLALPASRAVLQANLGTVAQTRAELSAYSWPAWPIQDAVRRSHSADLTPAIARYERALELNPYNATANRRLGQIELSLGQYQSAGLHLTAAYTAEPEHRATQQMLGEYYALSGNIDAAVALWQHIDTTRGQLELRRWWYNDVDGDDRLLRLDDAIARLVR